MRKNSLVILGAVLLLGLILLVSGPFAIIGPGERGVVVQKGKVTGEIYSEGWYFYNSLTKDIIQFDTKSKVTTEQITAASQDLQDVTAEVAIQYRIDQSSVAKIVENIGFQKDVDEKIIDPAIQEVVKASTAQHPVADIIKKRSEVKQTTERLLAERLSGYGIVVEEVSIKNIEFSDEFTKAIERKQVAEQKKLQAKFDAEAEIAKAEGKAEAQRIEGEAINANPQILELRKIERWDGKLPAYMLGSGNPLVQLP